MSICWWRFTATIFRCVPSHIFLTTGLLVVIKYHNIQVRLLHLLIEIVIEFILCYSNLFTFFNQLFLHNNLKNHNGIFTNYISKLSSYYKFTFVNLLNDLIWIQIYWLYDYKIGLFLFFVIIFSFFKIMTFSPHFYKAFEII